MAEKPILYDAYGRPIERAALKREVAGPKLTGVRTPLTGYPGDGLNPRRLARLLRDADAGDPLRYLELAETIEERDGHYAGVLGTRKRSVAQLEIQVDAASDDPKHVEHADTIRSWLLRDELQDELFDILDAVGKGFSVTEIIWDTSMGQWRPRKLEWRDPRWFTFAREDLTTPLLRTDAGDVPLPGFKFIVASVKAKSGLPVRSGIARVASWLYMFKKFTERDWAIFTQTFGQPIRVGKYGAGATEEDKDTLYRAVANIAGDCAAIVPDSMIIEFVEAKNVTGSTKLYEERADWIDRQISKLVLGQTATTDAIAGGHAVGQEHRQVQKDIERADARMVSAVLNRDLVRPWIDLEYGPQELYPRLRVGRAGERDVKLTLEGIERMVPLGLRVQKSFVNDMLGIPDPDENAELLEPPQPAGPLPPFAGLQSPASAALQSVRRPQLPTEDALAGGADRLAARAQDRMLDTIRAAIEESDSPEAMQAKLMTLQLPKEELRAVLRQVLVLAELMGRADIAQWAGSGDA